MKKNVVTTITVMSLSAILVSGVGPAFASETEAYESKKPTATVVPVHKFAGQPSLAPPSGQAVPGGMTVGMLTPEEVRMFMNNGAFAGGSGHNGGYQTNNAATSLARKLAVAALRKSGGYMETALSKVIGKKYAAKAGGAFQKIANYIEKVEQVQETGIASILIGAGLPADVAIETAKWIVLFFGL